MGKFVPPNETPPGRRGAYIIGDLGVAHRHVQRIKSGQLPPSPAVIAEIEKSIETCVARVERDLAGEVE